MEAAHQRLTCKGPPSRAFGKVMLHMPVPRLLYTVNDMFFVVVRSESSMLTIVELVLAVMVKDWSSCLSCEFIKSELLHHNI
jgi:hypothetical protein